MKLTKQKLNRLIKEALLQERGMQRTADYKLKLALGDVIAVSKLIEGNPKDAAGFPGLKENVAKAKIALEAAYSAIIKERI